MDYGECGDIENAAACFMYLRGTPGPTLWQTLENAAKTYCFWTSDRELLVKQLEKWVAGREDDNGYLAFISHMGKEGAQPERECCVKETITWSDLGGLIDSYVESTYLIGCKSHLSYAPFAQLNRAPRYLALTTVDINLLQSLEFLITFLDDEISLSTRCFPEAVSKALADIQPLPVTRLFRLDRYTIVDPRDSVDSEG